MAVPQRMLAVVMGKGGTDRQQLSGMDTLPVSLVSLLSSLCTENCFALCLTRSTWISGLFLVPGYFNFE